MKRCSHNGVYFTSELTGKFNNTLKIWPFKARDLTIQWFSNVGSVLLHHWFFVLIELPSTIILNDIYSL